MIFQSYLLAAAFPSARSASERCLQGIRLHEAGVEDRIHRAAHEAVVEVIAGGGEGLSGADGSLITGPDIVTRGFVYVKESEELMDALKELATDVMNDCEARHITDWAAIKGAVKGEISSFLYKKTKRSPMILPVIMEV